MNRHRFPKLQGTIILAACLLLLSQTSSVRAHPADIYAHTINVTISAQNLLVDWQIKPGPMLSSNLWFKADLDQDGTISQAEADTWGNQYASVLIATLNKEPFPLPLTNVQFPSANGFQAGTEFIVLSFTAEWPQGAENDLLLELDNGFDRGNSLNWFSLSSQGNAAFLSPVQSSGKLSVNILRDKAASPDVKDLLSSWDSGTPALPQGQQKDAVSQAAGQVVPELARNTPQEVLTGLVREEEFSLQFYILALGIALALGALHALTPGHGKTIVAAYLVGTRGTTRHALALGSIVTLTHTGSVFLLGLVTLAASQYILPTRIIPVMEVISGLLIVGLGIYLLVQRVQYWKKEKEHQRAHAQGHHHEHGHGQEHGHSHEIPETITWRSLVALGVSGGLVPCPDAIAILLVAIAINRILLGLVLIVAFSLGLAIVLIVIGLAMVNSRRLFDRMDGFSRFAPILPIVSAAAVLILGAALVYGAFTRFQGSASATAADPSSANDARAFNLDRARVVYLDEDQMGHYRLVIANTKGKIQKVLTEAPIGIGVIDFALSPDQSKIIYVYQTEDTGNSLWLVNIDGRQNHEVVPCGLAVCNRPIWSPDGKRVIFEKMDLSGQGVFTGLASLWWFDLETGDTEPVFQDSQLPGSNPRWSPDGEWLSYSTLNGLRLYNLETGESRSIKSILGGAANWSPDSQAILFRDVLIQNSQYVAQLFLYRLSSDDIVNLNSDTNFENALAAWSPDGSQVAVIRRDLSVPKGDQLWLISADGSNARPITDIPAALHGSLNWSPDGKYLLYDVYFLDTTPKEWHLQIVDVASGQVMDSGLTGSNPKWVTEK